MYVVFDAIIPVFILVLLGMLFRSWQFPSENFWIKADKVTYFIFLPSLIIEKLAITSFTFDDFYISTIPMVLVVLFISFFLFGLKLIWPISGESFTSVFQGSIRPNTYVVLATASALFGGEGLVLTTIILAGIIPLVNILSVLSFSFYIGQNKKGPKDLIKEVITNPLVLACLVGVILNWTGVGLPFVTEDVFSILSSAALPMGLISVGFGLQIRSGDHRPLPIAIASFIKLVMMPFLAYSMVEILGIDGLNKSLIVLFATVPCSASSYILSGQLKGDQPLMATIISIETLLAFLSIPLMLIMLT